MLFGDRQAAARRLPLRAPRRAHADAARRGSTREATVGLCLSLTNFSLMPKEMLACGLPCVELAGVSAESIFGDGRPARARRRSNRSRSPTRSSACSTTASAGSAARARASSSSPPTPGITPPTRSKPACATRCASGSLRSYQRAEAPRRRRSGTRRGKRRGERNRQAGLTRPRPSPASVRKASATRSEARLRGPHVRPRQAQAAHRRSAWTPCRRAAGYRRP